MSERSIRILFVSSDEESRTTTQAKLEEAGFMAVTARDSQEARAMFLGVKFSLVISEGQLSDQNGVQLANLLKRAESTKPSRPTTPIVLLSNDPDIGAPVAVSLVLPSPLRAEDFRELLKLIR